MKVAEVMTAGVDMVDPDSTVQDAATRMAELDVGAVMIGSDAGIDGVLTDRDILVRVVVEGRNSAEVQARDVMSPRVWSCGVEDDAAAALAEMRERQIRRMPVRDADDRFVGVVTFSDLAKAVGGPDQARELLREISEPHRSRTDPDEAEADTAEGEPPAAEQRA